MSTLECPDPTVIGAILAGTLDGSARAGVLRHIENCPACRSVLDRLTDRTVELPPTPTRPNQSGPTQADTGLARSENGPPTDLARSENRLGQATQPASANAPRPVPAGAPGLPFLDPPGEEGSLGRLGSYEILQVLGEGSVGVVLKGYEPRLRRHVAVKVLAPQLVHSVPARRRFAREGRATAALDHENIVTVHAVEDQAERPYLVMEYVPGLSLQQRLDRCGALPLREAVRIAAGVSAGLAAAHAGGLIHRDVKPGNILLDADGRGVKLTDFGLVQEEEGTVSQTDVLAGTPLYMSPEQARGQRVDARSDLFSLGSVLYAMCAGRPPFSGRNPLAVLRQISEAAPPPVRRLNSDVPAWLGELIGRLHAKDPASVPAAAEAARILEEHLADPSLTAPPRRWRLALATLAVLALVGLAAAEVRGLTDLRGRWRTWSRGEAALVIDNDDPEAVIRLAGRAEELSGVGSSVWKVPPGDYLLLTSRPEERRREELIHLGKGEQQEVRIERRPAPVAAGPFVVLPRQGGRARGCASLGEAVGQARTGETIEVRGNGPFVVPPVRLTRAVMVRAGTGYKPVLQHDGKDLKAPLIDTNRPLVLEGLQLEGSGFGSWKEGYFSLVHSRGASLGVAGCRLQVQGDGACIIFEGRRLDVRRSFLVRGESGHGAINWDKTAGSEILLDGCVLAGGHMGVRMRLPVGKGAGKLRVGHSTLYTQNAFVVLANADAWANKPPARRLLDVEVADSVLASTSYVFQFNQPGRTKGEPLPFPVVHGLLPKLTAYRDRGSFYPTTKNLLSFSSDWKTLPGGRTYSTLSQWWDFWGQPATSDALQNRIAFQGENVLARLIKGVAHVPATDFRLAAGSPGKGTARDGKDFGADIDLVGPGPALDRWRLTPEYQDWRRQAERLLSDKKESR